MPKGFTILFLVCIGIMLTSEYMLLQEYFADKRVAIMGPSALILICSIIIFLYSYKKYRKATR